MKKRAVLPLILVIAWQLFIWSNSMKPAAVSGGESQAVLRWLLESFPFLSWMVETFLRKLAHFTEYAILGVLLTWLFRRLKTIGYHRVTMPLLCAMLGACIDETIQLFPEGRSCEVVDVWIDTAGACTGIALFLIGLAVYIKMKGNCSK